jgi:hypothetical protein
MGRQIMYRLDKNTEKIQLLNKLRGEPARTQEPEKKDSVLFEARVSETGELIRFGYVIESDSIQLWQEKVC